MSPLEPAGASAIRAEQATSLGTSPAANQPHLRDHLYLLLRRRWLMLGVVMAIVLSVLCFTLATVPLYQSTTTLHIQLQQGQNGGSLDLLADAFGVEKGRELDTEIEILKSRILAETAVRRLHYQFQAVPSHNGLVVLYRKLKALLPWTIDMPWLSLPSWLSLPRQPAFSFHDVEVGEVTTPEGGERYTITVLDSGAFVVRNAQDKREIGRGEIGQPFRSQQVAFRLESQEMQPGDQVAFTLLSLEWATEQFQRRREVALIRKTEIVKVSTEASAPTLARDMAMALAQAYVDFNLRQKTQQASQALAFIARQLVTTHEQLRASEGVMSRFKEEHKFVTLDSEAQATLAKLSQFDTALKELQSRVKEAEDLRQRLQTKGTALESRSIYALGTGQESPILVALADRLSTLQATLDGLRAQYTAKHPVVLQAEQQVQGVKEKIAEEVAMLSANLRSRAAALQDILREYETRLERLPQAERDLANLTRQVSINGDIYAFLLKKQEETRILEASTISNVHVLDPPEVPGRSVSPRVKRDLLLAAVLGLLLGLGAVRGVEYFDDSLKTIEEAEQQVGLPLLGAIPELHANGRTEAGSSTPIVLLHRQGQNFAASEGFRSLCMNLQFLSVGAERRRTFVITSPQTGDGKSTVAANLGLFSILTGQKTLLVDADLRKPSLARAFGLPRTPGLTEVLQGQHRWQEAVHTVEERLHVLPAGELPLSPAEWLASRRLRELLGEWEAAYDYVLFDVPPVLAVTDPVIVGSLCQGVLLVVRANMTSTRMLKRTQALLEAAHVPVVGMVLNGLKATWGYGSSYHYYSAYYYGYGENGKQRGRKHRKHRRHRVSQNGQEA